MMRILSILLVLILSACGNAPSGVGTTGGSGTSGGGATSGSTVTGSVGDGPVSGATLTFVDAGGTTLTVTDNNTSSSGSSATSTASAGYNVTLPATTVFPVTVTATGGVDLARKQLGLTSTAPTMTMTSVIVDSYSSVAHVSPLTTVVVEIAKTLTGGVTTANIVAAKQKVASALGLGLDALSADFMTTATASISTADMATILQASEALGAIIARTVAATTGATESSVVTTLATDISVDGVLDASDNGTGIGTREATNLQQVHANIQADLYSSHVVKLDATDIAGTTSTVSLDVAGLTTLASTIGVTLTATDPYAADAQLKVSSQSATSNAPQSINLLSNASTGQTADGSGSYTVTIQVLNSGSPVLGQVVGLTWTSSAGGIVQITQPVNPLVTDSNGTVQVTVTDINSQDDTVKLSAAVGALTTPSGSELALSFTGTGSGTSGGGTTTTTTTGSNTLVPSKATIGTVVKNGAALNPQQGSLFDLYTSSTAIDTYGTWASGTNTVQLQFLVRDTNGVALSGQSVNFSASGSLGGSPQLSPSGMTTLNDGYATVTLTDATAETVTVTAAVGSISATQAVTFFAMDPASLQLQSANPTTIGISGSSSATTASTLTFQVLDVNNHVVQGSHQVDFSIVGGGLNGGESLNASSATTLNGVVSTVLGAGSKAGTVTVHAQLHATPAIGTDATITIAGGLPAGNSFVLASNPLNIAGRTVLGLTQTMTAFISDFFGNPVSSGVGVQFQNDFANIIGSATFADGGSGSQATTTIISAAPQPTDGVVTIAAQTTGGIHSKILSIAINPSDPNVIYLGTDGGGVFQTTDGGSTWKHVGVPLKGNGANQFTSLTGTVVRDLKIDPNNSSTVYAATDRGLFVSTDAGGAWQTLTGLRRVSGDIVGTAAGSALSSKGAGESFTFNFTHNGVRARTTIYVNGVAEANYVLNASSNSITMLKTLTAGDKVTADYDTASGISASFPLYAVVVDKNTYGIQDQYAYAGSIYVGTLGGGVWKTTTGGKQWSKMSGMKSSGQSFNLRVLSLAIDPYNSGLLFAGTDGGGLFVSDNYAASWSKVLGTTSHPISESTVQTIISRSPYVWVGGRNGVHFTDNYAGNWYTPTTSVNASDQNNLDVRALAYDPNDGTLYAATFGDVLKQSDPYGGVYSSSDYYTWSKAADVGTVAGAHTLDALDIYAQVGADVLAAGSEGRLLSVSNDAGSTWSAKPGNGSATLNNTLFATLGVMHSGNLNLQLIPQTMTYQPQKDGTTGGFGSSGTIYNGESHSFYIRVADDLGNPLVSGSTLAVSASAGTVSGDTAVTVADSVHGGGDYTVTWVNDLATVSTTDVLATMTVTVNSTNGNASQVLTKTLVNPVNGSAPAVTDNYSTANPSSTYTAVSVTGAGGSNGANGYAFTAGLGCSSKANPCPANGHTITSGANVSSATFYYLKPTAAGTVTDTVTIKDNITKRSSSPVSVTITYQ